MSVHVLLILLLLFPAAPGLGRSLNVFFPSTIPAAARQKALSESQMGLTQVMVFAKFKEFEDFQKASPAEFIIVPSSYSSFNKDYTCTHQFLAGGESDFKFQLLSVDKSWNLGKTEQGVLGVVDELGRREMKEYVDKLLAGRKFKQVTRVTNTEDLFGLIALENANYILVSPLHFAELKDRYKLNTSVVMESAPVKHPFICAKGGSKLDLTKLGPQVVKSLGYAGITEIK